MQAFFQKLRAGISSPRLSKYRSGDESDFEVIAKYVWNIALCEALYPALHTLEVALRNAIHQAAVGCFHRDDWFEPPDSPLRASEQAGITQAKGELKALKEPQEVDGIVSQLTFGFWVSLLNSRYEQVLWPRMLLPAFPGMPRRSRNRPNLCKRFNEIRTLRNRVFHHQRISHTPSLANRHAEMLEAIGWINPQFLQVLTLADRFQTVYAAGLDAIREKLGDLLAITGTEFNV